MKSLILPIMKKEFIEVWRDTRSLEEAFRAAFNMTQGGFEQRWQQRTRRRYGALALFADFTVAVSVMLLLLLPLYVARRRRNRERLRHMARAEATAEQRERESAVEALLASVSSARVHPEGPTQQGEP